MEHSFMAADKREREKTGRCPYDFSVLPKKTPYPERPALSGVRSSSLLCSSSL